MESSPGQGFELVKGVENKGMFVLGKGCHVSQFFDVSISDPECEYGDAQIVLEHPGSRSGIAPVAVAIRDEKYCLE